MELKQLHKLIEAINAYYAFALLVYVLTLYVASHSHLFYWVFIAVTPLLAGWSGYLLKILLDRRNQRHGFRVLSDVMTYEVVRKNKYILRYATKIKAGADHLMAYPVGYQWTGGGKVLMPRATGTGQQMLTLIDQDESTDSILKAAPYKVTDSTEGDWHYWFVAINPPVHKGEVVEIKYSQEFHDETGIAKPYLYYFVRTPMKRLELNVKFPKNSLPKTVNGYLIKPSDPSRPYLSDGVYYEPDKQWATWVIEKPKKGYCYRIQWQ